MPEIALTNRGKSLMLLGIQQAFLAGNFVKVLIFSCWISVIAGILFENEYFLLETQKLAAVLKLIIPRKMCSEVSPLILNNPCFDVISSDKKYPLFDLKSGNCGEFSVSGKSKYCCRKIVVIPNRAVFDLSLMAQNGFECL